jgi:Alginate export
MKRATLIVCCCCCCMFTSLTSSEAAGEPTDEEPLALHLGDAVTLIPSGQYRPRFLFHGGRDFKEGKTFDAFSHRTRLGVKVELLEWFGAMIQLQDVRLWGEETNTLGDFSADGLGVHQAWVEASCPLGLTLRIGRQEINLDNQRLIGAVGWADQGRPFDAVHLNYKLSGTLTLRAFYAKVGDEDAYVEGKDAKGNPKALKGTKEDIDLAALHMRYTGFDLFRPSVLAIYDWFGPKNQNRATLGLYVDSAPIAGFSYTGEFYYQLGRTGPDGQRKDIGALFGAVGLTYKAPLPGKPSLSVWFEYVGGDDDATDDELKSFDTLYATNHKFYGFMDYFLAVPVHAGGYGLIDIGGRLKVAPFEGFFAFLDFHHFEYAAERGTSCLAGGACYSKSTTLGNEVDLLVNYKINKYVSVQGVLAAFFPKLGISLLRGGGDETEMYGYLQTNLQF